VTNLHPDLRPATGGAIPAPDRALTIGAHPDDAEFGAGGTLAAWAGAGTEVTVLVVTDGSKGTWEPDVRPADLIATRRAEQRAAAEVLGAGEVVFLDHVDGELEPSMELRRELCGWIRRLRPDVVLTHDPWRRYLLHPDHRAAGFAAVDAVVAARDHLFFPEQAGEQGLRAHRPGALLLWATDQPDHWEDVAATLDVKIGALLCHSSQTATTMGDAASGEAARAAFAERIRRRAAESGEPAGLSAAEAFRRITP
jgi:LmbE family N-acetylglucosaminyl deacetylase